MMLSALILALAVGWILRGSISNLAHLELRRFDLMVAGFALQMLLSRASALGWSLLLDWGFPLLLLSYGILLYVMWENRHLPGMTLVSVGVLFNLAVIALNGGMPVSPEALAVTGQEAVVPMLRSGEFIIHTLMTEDTLLPFLGDHIVTPRWFPHGLRTVFSPGDLVMMMGLLWLVPRAMQRTIAREELSDGCEKAQEGEKAGA